MRTTKILDERTYYERVHKKYDEVVWVKDSMYFARRLKEFMPEGGGVLDYGCSGGEMSYLINRVLQRDVVGVDVNSYAIKKAKLEEPFVRPVDGTKVSFVKDFVWVASGLMLGEKGVPIEYSHIVLHHVLSHIGEGYKDLLRLLLAGARVPTSTNQKVSLSIVVPNFWYLLGKMPGNLFSSYVGDPTVKDYFGRRKLGRLFKELGLTVIHIEEYGDSLLKGLTKTSKIRNFLPRARLMMIGTK
jgi:SAM-dependent methyltransferase